MIRRLIKIFLALFIALSGLGFLALGIFILRTPSQSDSNPISAFLLVFFLGILFLTIAYRALRKLEQTSSVSQCCTCGATTQIPEVFFSERRFFGSSYRLYCPLCWSKRKASNYKWKIVALFFLACLGLILLKVSPGLALAYFFINLFLFQVLEIVSIFMHELAHAWTAKKMGMHVHRISIGVGKRLFKGKFFDLEIDYRAYPIIGVVFATYQAREKSNTRQLLFVAAGPFMNVSLALLAFIIVPTNELGYISIFFDRIAPWHLLFWLNVLILITNLWPRKVATPLGIVETDGLQLVKNIRKNEEELDRRYFSYFLLEGTIHAEKKEYNKARVFFEKGLEYYKENVFLLTHLGIVQTKLNDFLAARESFQKAMALSTTPAENALIMNNIAYVDALIGDRDLFGEADRYSQQAMLALSWLPAIKGTRGTVLLQLGKTDEAIVQLKDALRLNDEPDGKAQNCCFLAIAERTRGNLAQSDQYLAEARRLDRDCFLLERVEKLFAT